jgi:putative Mg2+ transporter-C (MgtC) family protein
MGSALFTLVSAYGFSEFRGIGSSSPDPTRIAAQIVSGIGFLGAGAILRQGLNVRGLTTAATLWIVAAIGMASGAGYFFGAIVTTLLTLPALILFRHLRRPLMTRLRQDFVVMELEIAHGQDLGRVFSVLAHYGVRVHGMSSEINGDDKDHAQLELRIPPGTQFEQMLEQISGLDGIDHVEALGRRWAVRFHPH